MALLNDMHDMETYQKKKFNLWNMKRTIASTWLLLN